MLTLDQAFHLVGSPDFGNLPAFPFNLDGNLLFCGSIRLFPTLAWPRPEEHGVVEVHIDELVKEHPVEMLASRFC